MTKIINTEWTYTERKWKRPELTVHHRGVMQWLEHALLKAIQQLTWWCPQREGLCTWFYPSLLSWVVHRVAVLGGSVQTDYQPT